MQKLRYKKGLFKHGSMVFSIMTLFAMSPLAAQELQDILRKSLISDPSLLEAKANEAAAQSTTKATKAGHYPVISAVGTQMLFQQNDKSSDDLTSGIGLKGSVNLYAWGGIEAGVKRDQQKEIYYKHKYFETQEELGSTIGKLYLKALRARESLLVSEQSLSRHDKLLKDLGLVVQYDAGRRSELIEARAKYMQVQTSIAQLRRTMELALSELSKYTAKPVRPQDLRDPFRSDTTSILVRRYKTEDTHLNPSYLAQKAERESLSHELDVSKAARRPAINLESYLAKDSKQLYLNMTWSLFDEAKRHTVGKNEHTLVAADARLDNILREVAERARSAEIDMAQSEQRVNITAEHIIAQKEVVKAYELQFKVARRTLTDVLDAYSALSNIEQDNITARNDFRDAALEYLVAQSQVAKWAGVTEIE